MKFNFDNTLLKVTHWLIVVVFMCGFFLPPADSRAYLKRSRATAMETEFFSMTSGDTIAERLTFLGSALEAETRIALWNRGHAGNPKSLQDFYSLFIHPIFAFDFDLFETALRQHVKLVRFDFAQEPVKSTEKVSEASEQLTVILEFNDGSEGHFNFKDSRVKILIEALFAEAKKPTTQKDPSSKTLESAKLMESGAVERKLFELFGGFRITYQSCEKNNRRYIRFVGKATAPYAH